VLSVKYKYLKVMGFYCLNLWNYFSILCIVYTRNKEQNCFHRKLLFCVSLFMKAHKTKRI